MNAVGKVTKVGGQVGFGELTGGKIKLRTIFSSIAYCAGLYGFTIILRQR